MTDIRIKKIGSKLEEVVDLESLLRNVEAIIVSSESFRLRKYNGELKRIYHRFFVDMLCQRSEDRYDRILEYSVDKKLNLFKSFYNQNYIEKEHWDIIKKEYKKRKIKKLFDFELED